MRWLACLVLLGLVVPAIGVEAQPASQPNIVLFQADDMRADDLVHMPKLRRLLMDRGVTFREHYAAVPLCCPNRSSLLRGQYAHNHGVLGNSGPSGGAAAFQLLEDDTLATRLDAAGYVTGNFGKYLNNKGASVDPRHVPPGWDEWSVFVDSSAETDEGLPCGESYYAAEDQWCASVDGRIVRPAVYATDWVGARAARFITNAEDPFFTFVNPYAPHLPARPAKRHVDDPVRAWKRSAAFNEKNVTDKPAWVRKLPRIDAKSENSLERLRNSRARTLYAFDEVVSRVAAAVEAKGALANTWFVFTSDNGLFLGEHRIECCKLAPYDPAARLPLVVAGPGLAKRSVDLPTSTIDLLPTLLAWAGVEPPAYADGRDLSPLLADPAAPWREAALVEWDRPSAVSAQDEGESSLGATSFSRLSKAEVPAYIALRAPSYLYVEWADGFREYYDRTNDPHELTNVYDDLAAAERDALAERLNALRTCAEQECRAADGGQ